MFQLQFVLLHPDIHHPSGGYGHVLPADGEEVVGGADHWRRHAKLGQEQKKQTEGNPFLD